MICYNGTMMRYQRYTPEYWAWRDMKKRCLLANNKYFHNYGGRGIRVCKRWLKSFDLFMDDMGEKPTAKHSLDRINNDGDYKPSNCRWATKLEQDNNRRTNVWIEHNGVTKNYRQWALYYGIRPDKLRYYILKGLPLLEAVSKCK